MTAASATAITMDEIMDLYYSLRAALSPQCRVHHERFDHQGHSQIEERQRRLSVAAQPDRGQPDTLLNRPVYTSSYMPTIAATNKVILFGDLGYYWVADREGRSFKRFE